MKELILITDYKGHFGSKWKAQPYRSGYDKKLLQELFAEKGFSIRFIEPTELTFSGFNWKNKTVLYTSSEELNLKYKDFLEDVISALHLAGANLIPGPEFLRANNNKVMMELLRDILLPEELRTIRAQSFGTIEELKQALEDGKIDLPCVIKKASGAMSRGVELVKSKEELLRKATRLMNTKELRHHLKESVRARKHPGYFPESSYQGKLIIQPFIPNLSNDWKVLVYGKRIFVLRRNIRPDDFRASGSGFNYTSGSECGFPESYLPFVHRIQQAFNLPNISIDFAHDGTRPYIFEFQALYFGTSTQYKSKDYYELENGEWVLKPNTFSQEQVYVDSIAEFLQTK
jgi:glutathione synthase/RimK-type ligase-like ATP-grasp enzyme